MTAADGTAPKTSPVLLWYSNHWATFCSLYFIMNSCSKFQNDDLIISTVVSIRKPGQSRPEGRSKRYFEGLLRSTTTEVLQLAPSSKVSKYLCENLVSNLHVLRIQTETTHVPSPPSFPNIVSLSQL